jgi:hypothetical protein
MTKVELRFDVKLEKITYPDLLRWPSATFSHKRERVSEAKYFPKGEVFTQVKIHARAKDLRYEKMTLSSHYVTLNSNPKLTLQKDSYRFFSDQDLTHKASRLKNDLRKMKGGYDLQPDDKI